jgi:xanthine/CO dehydrogenase XdhC/CoxF family maturation factor
LPVIRKYDTADDEQLATGVATGCGGTVDVLIQPISLNLPGPLQHLRRLLVEREPVRLATLVRSKDRAAIGQVRCGNPVSATASDEWFVETLRPPQRLVIFGAGPDVVPLLEIATTLGWSVSVVGSHARAQQATRFTGRVDFHAADAADPAGNTSLHPTDAVLVMTHNIARDRTILQSLTIRPRYLGVLGPRHRLEQIIGDLPPDVRETVISPIGLDLGAETPQEIALAIMAEIQANLRHASAERLSEKAGPIHDRPADADPDHRFLRAFACPI